MSPHILLDSEYSSILRSHISRQTNARSNTKNNQPFFSFFFFFLTLQTGDLTGFDFAIYEMYPFNPLFAVAFGQHVLSR